MFSLNYAFNHTTIPVLPSHSWNITEKAIIVSIKQWLPFTPQWRKYRYFLIPEKTRGIEKEPKLNKKTTCSSDYLSRNSLIKWSFVARCKANISTISFISSFPRGNLNFFPYTHPIATYMEITEGLLSWLWIIVQECSLSIARGSYIFHAHSLPL